MNDRDKAREIERLRNADDKTVVLDYLTAKMKMRTMAAEMTKMASENRLAVALANAMTDLVLEITTAMIMFFKDEDSPTGAHMREGIEMLSRDERAELMGDIADLVQLARAELTHDCTHCPKVGTCTQATTGNNGSGGLPPIMGSNFGRS